MANVVKTGYSRVFLIENRASPANAPEYMGLAKAGAVSWSLGDVTTIRIPDPGRYDSFQRIGKIIGDPGDPELPLTVRFTDDLSRFFQIAKRGCDSDIQVHIGECQDPRDFNAGWNKVLILESGRITNYGTGEIGALEPGERAMVNEELPFTGEDYYEVGRIVFAEQASSQIVQEIVDITICDAVTCGACGIASDGCQVVFAVSLRAGASPGQGAEVIYTQDGGANWEDTQITTITGSDDPNALACVGTYLVVVSEDGESLHYASIADILDGVETWAEVTTGFVAAKGPRAIYAYDPSHVWIVGAGGYIYFSNDPTSLVEVQEAGVSTTQDLNAIHGLDQLNIVAVGASNAVVYTRNGGSTWSTVTGPAVGVALTAVWMKSKDEWIVGTAGGRLYYTRNAGTTWTEKSFPGSQAGVVRDIQFTTPSVGYMAHSTAAPAGRILRTIDGGYSWYVLPEGQGNIPTNDYVGALAVCSDPNIIFGGGLAGNAVDGFVVKGAA